jgi:hypothetical protein
VGVSLPGALSLSRSSLRLLVGGKDPEEVQYDAVRNELVWFDVATRDDDRPDDDDEDDEESRWPGDRPTRRRRRMSETMAVRFEQPGELYAQDKLVVTVDAEVPGELLSGTQARLFDARGYRHRKDDPLKVRSVVTTTCEVDLGHTFRRRPVTPYQSFHFDEVVPGKLRVADILAVLADQRFVTKDWELASGQEKGQMARHVIIATREDGPDVIELFIVVEGQRQNTRREIRSPDSSHRTKFISGDLWLYVYGEAPRDARTVVHEINKLQRSLRERFSPAPGSPLTAAEEELQPEPPAPAHVEMKTVHGRARCHRCGHTTVTAVCSSCNRLLCREHDRTTDLADPWRPRRNESSDQAAPGVSQAESSDPDAAETDDETGAAERRRAPPRTARRTAAGRTALGRTAARPTAPGKTAAEERRRDGRRRGHGRHTRRRARGGVDTRRPDRSHAGTGTAENHTQARPRASLLPRLPPLGRPHDLIVQTATAEVALGGLAVAWNPWIGGVLAALGAGRIGWRVIAGRRRRRRIPQPAALFLGPADHQAGADRDAHGRGAAAGTGAAWPPSRACPGRSGWSRSGRGHTPPRSWTTGAATACRTPTSWSSRRARSWSAVPDGSRCRPSRPTPGPSP